MRWKIVLANAGIVVVVTLLSYVLLATSLKDVVSNPNERKREVAQALRAANAQLALDALRLERWISEQAATKEVRDVYTLGLPQARSESATVQANRLRDAAGAEGDFAKMAPSLVLFVDEDGIAIGRDGSALMRGDKMLGSYPSLTEALKQGRTGSSVWLNRERQEQMLASFAPVHSEDGTVAGAVVIGTPLNDERLSRTSELTSGHALIFGIQSNRGLELVADSGNTTTGLLDAVRGDQVAQAAQAALKSGAVSNAPTVENGHFLGVAQLSGYVSKGGVLVAAVPASLVGSLPGLLWPVLGVGLLGLLLVVIAGVLLGNYISRPVSELEDGLLAVINGNSELRFQIEHPDLGGLVFRINSLLNAMMGVPEDNTDEEGRSSVSPTAADFTEQ